MLQIKLLGQFELCREGGEIIVLPSRKARALLAYLVLADGIPQSRDKLTALLWERSAEEQARLSLRQTLSVLRRTCPPKAAACSAVSPRSLRAMGSAPCSSSQATMSS